MYSKCSKLNFVNSYKLCYTATYVYVHEFQNKGEYSTCIASYAMYSYVLHTSYLENI